MKILQNLPKHLLTLGLISTLSACISIGPPKPSDSFPATFQPSVKAKSQPTSKLDTEDLFNAKNLDDITENHKKVIISRFNVSFVVKNKTSASVQGGSTLGGGYSSGSKAKLDIMLGNISRQDMQKIVDKIYADLLAQLEKAGYEVIPPEKFRNTVGYKGISFYQKGKKNFFVQESSMRDPRTLITLSPSGLPLWFERGGDVGIMQGVRNNSASAYMGHELNAFVLSADLTIDFTHLSSSGRSIGFLGGGRAQVAATPWLHLARINYMLNITNEKGGIIDTGWFNYDGNERLSVKRPFGKIEQISSKKEAGSIWGLGNAGIFSSAASSKGSYALKADPKAFEQGVLEMMQATNQVFVKELKQ